MKGASRLYEIKVTSGYYITYAPGRLVYIRLQGLVLEITATMLSVGVASTNSDYANGNMEGSQYLLKSMSCSAN